MKKSINVDKSFNDMRIDRFIRNHLGKIPQGLIEKNLRNGKLKLNQKKIKSSQKVKTGDKLNIYNLDFEEKIEQLKKKYNPSNEIIKENEDLIIENNDNFVVLNKQSGISVQGGTKSKKNIIDIFAKSNLFRDEKPYSVHRLDKDTSGVFIIAKNRETAQLLTSLFRLRKVYKTYLAICNGELILAEKGAIKDDLIRFENKKKIIEKAETKYEILDKNNNATFIQLNPITGRKHQLRKQLFNLGNSIIGDKKYNSANNPKINNKNLMLHSYEIKFKINDKKYTFRATPPDYFRNMLKTKRLNF
ncbi:RluA family pseudouridine synthase [Candidatus Pelagibacter sp.]|nr:RluA family pseudouridine synthase [Candidatus Pelagibacter sp.]